MNLINGLRTGLNALLLIASFGLSAGVALAQPYPSNASPPRIEGFDVEPARRLSAGNELLFTLHGTPGGTATVRIAGVAGRIVLEEVGVGVYEGAYAIRNRDRITADAAVTANLRLGNRIASEVLDEPLLAAARPPRRANGVAQGLRVERFEIDPPARLAVGEQIFFTVHGTPGARSSVRIAGVRARVLLEEVRSGRYEGSYAIRERDRLAPDAMVSVRLELGNRDAAVTLDRPLMAGPGPGGLPPQAASGPPPVAQRAPRVCANCGVVEAVNVVDVQGEGSYVGKIAGGVVGGLLGSQVGQGRGRTAAEIAGAVGGAVAGNEIEKRSKNSRHYDVIARMTGGGTQTVSYATEPQFRVGDRVRVENNLLVPDL